MEHVPGADILNSYAGLACVEEPNDMITESSLDVAEEEIIDDDDDDITLTGVCASCSSLRHIVLGRLPALWFWGTRSPWLGFECYLQRPEPCKKESPFSVSSAYHS